MHFPEQELWSVEDVAARWEKSVSYVRDLIRRKLLPLKINRARLMRVGETPMNLRLMPTQFVGLEDLKTFEDIHARALKPRISIKEYSFKHNNRSDKQIRRDIKDKTLDAEMIHGRWMILE